MREPYEYGDWAEDYHHCVGEYTCEVNYDLCPLEGDGFQRLRTAALAKRFQRPRSFCPTCDQETGIAPQAP